MFNIETFIEKRFTKISLKKKVDKRGKINLASNELLSDYFKTISTESDKNSQSLFEVNSYTYYPSIREKISKLIEVNEENIEFFSGSDSAIFYLMTIISKKSDQIIIQYPNYENYFSYAKLNDITMIPWNMRTEGVSFYIDDLFGLLSLHKGITVVIITNPNGFSGSSLTLDEIYSIADKLNSIGVMLIIDLAYIGFSKKQSVKEYFELCSIYENVVLVNTFSKNMGLAGERFGYIYGSTEFIQYIRNWNGINSISNHTYYLVEKFLADNTITNIVKKVQKNRDNLTHWVKNNTEYRVYESDANFILFQHEDTLKKQIFVDQFLNNGFVVRDLSNFDVLRNCTRVTVPESSKMLESIKKILKGK